jgi:hypothetical protein
MAATGGQHLHCLICADGLRFTQVMEPAYRIAG